MQTRLSMASIACITVLLGLSCEETIDVGQPKTELNSTVVFEDDATAVAAISALYYRLVWNSNSVLIFTIPASLSADDLMMEDGNEFGQFYHNDLTAINSRVEAIWRNAYTGIYNANAIIQGLEKSTKITEATKQQLKGEAKFFRAFYHFYLVNFFGDVPYVNSTDYRVNSSAKRMPRSDVYREVVADLIDARDLLAEDYSRSRGGRVRANKWAAAALLARVYLYIGDYARAEEQATRVLERTSLYKLEVDPNLVFLENSTEAILQIIPNYPQQYTAEGGWLNKPWYSLENPRIPTELFNAFEDNDKRKFSWIGVGSSAENTWYYPVKYKESSRDTVGSNEYTMVLRLAEQYLIRAEARVRQNKLTGANSGASDLNIIRNRAGLANTTFVTQQELLFAIEQERRLELFCEWGHRWFDLKRTMRASDVLSSVKADWTDTDIFYPIPFSELRLNPSLTPQNDGY